MTLTRSALFVILAAVPLSAEGVTEDDLRRMMQANFDTALDAR